jgi:inorganic pyrophosphatase
MTFPMNENYWKSLQALITDETVVIDRPRGVPHPRYPELIYPLDYGYIEGTTAGDGDGIDIWIGSSGGRTLTGILCTFDTVKRDAEIKLLAGCTEEDLATIRHFHGGFMYTLYIPRPDRLSLSKP